MRASASFDVTRQVGANGAVTVTVSRGKPERPRVSAALATDGEGQCAPPAANAPALSAERRS